MYKLFITLSVLFFFNKPLKASNYSFYATQEGIYKLAIPNDLIKKTIYIHFEKLSYYQVHKEEKYIYFYCPRSGVYQISDSKKEISKKYKLPKNLILEKKSYYKYSLKNTNNTSHWLTDIISEKEPYSINVPIYQTSDLNKKIKFELYNFVNGNTPVSISLNDRNNKYLIKNSGDYDITIPLTKDERHLKIQINSFFNEIGIHKIILSDFYLNNDLDYSLPLGKYIYSRPKDIIDLDDEYAYATIEDNIFKKVKKGFKVKNLIVQKASNILEIKNIRKVKKLPFITTDFLILYNNKFHSYSEINNLKELLLSIDPNLNYSSINVQNIYDVYSNGTSSAISIKSFLHSKANFKYLLLVGDSDNRGGLYDIIPTMYFEQETNQTLVETDYPYTYLKNPGAPKFSIGRIPVNSNNDLNNYIDKVYSFINTQHKTKYAIYDDLSIIKDNFNGAIQTSFEKQSSIAKVLGKETITPFIESKKPRVFQFTGHATYTGWSDNEKVDINDIKDLSFNTLFMLIDLSCWTGTYSYQKRNSFSENVLAIPDKGSVATISASGYTHTANYNNITNFFISRKGEAVGEVLRKMKMELFNTNQISLDDIQTYNLLGIPTLKL